MENNEKKKESQVRVKLKAQLFNLTHIPKGFVEDTRFERLFERLSSHFLHSSERLEGSIQLGCLQSLSNGIVHDDERVVAISLRLLGVFASLSRGYEHIVEEKKTDLLSSLFESSKSEHPLVREASFKALKTLIFDHEFCGGRTNTSLLMEWMKGFEVTQVLFISLRDESHFVSRAAVSFFCQLIQVKECEKVLDKRKISRG